MTTSGEGIALIKKFEGFAARPYYCPAHKLTTGYGHVIEDGESLPNPMTPEEAEQLLHSDLERFEVGVTSLVRVPLSQQEFDALVSFAYNLGLGALKGSTLLKELNLGDRPAAAEQFLRWCHIGQSVSEGLLNRRRAERDLFLS